MAVRRPASAEGYDGPPQLQRWRKLHAKAEAGNYVLAGSKDLRHDARTLRTCRWRARVDRVRAIDDCEGDLRT
ncbi:MAG: hypothetical protein DMF92_16460 [Acidobacteria bacterium]|nr:MAG: hypothetical protein DMF92_16460 [Acidobacteriota bacterium]